MIGQMFEQMQGFIGYNPERASNDIKSLDDTLSDYIHNKLSYAVPFFFWDLSKVWASPKAVEFGNEFVPRFNDLCEELANNRITILQKSINAVAQVARANGLGFNYDFENFIQNFHMEFKEEINGLVGMNVDEAYKYGIEFLDQVRRFNANLDELDFHTIALYDSDGALQAAFKGMIKEFKDKFRELVDDICDAVNNAFHNEIKEIRLSKEQATQEMSN